MYDVSILTVEKRDNLPLVLVGIRSVIFIHLKEYFVHWNIAKWRGDTPS